MLGHGSEGRVRILEHEFSVGVLLPSGQHSLMVGPEVEAFLAHHSISLIMVGNGRADRGALLAACDRANRRSITRPKSAQFLPKARWRTAGAPHSCGNRAKPDRNRRPSFALIGRPSGSLSGRRRVPVAGLRLALDGNSSAEGRDAPCSLRVQEAADRCLGLHRHGGVQSSAGAAGEDASEVTHGTRRQGGNAAR
jgi:hypothetical protein